MLHQLLWFTGNKRTIWIKICPPLATSFKDLQFQSSKQETCPNLRIQKYSRNCFYFTKGSMKKKPDILIFFFLKHIASIGSISPSHTRRIKANPMSYSLSSYTVLLTLKQQESHRVKKTPFLFFSLLLDRECLEDRMMTAEALYRLRVTAI